MTRSEACEIQYRASIEKRSAEVMFNGDRVTMHILNHPWNEVQKAMIIHGDMKTGRSEWVPLDELSKMEVGQDA